MEKGVRRFELDFTGLWGCIKPSERVYTFSLEGLSCSSNLNHTKLTRPLDSVGICSLTALSLKYGNATGKVVEYCLSNCPLLKCLCVSGSVNIINLKVNNPSLSLDHLEISYCFNLEDLEISARNLSSLTYFGSKINIPFRSLPKLSKLSIGGLYPEHTLFLHLMSILSISPG